MKQTTLSKIIIGAIVIVMALALSSCNALLEYLGSPNKPLISDTSIPTSNEETYGTTVPLEALTTPSGGTQETTNPGEDITTPNEEITTPSGDTQETTNPGEDITTPNEEITTPSDDPTHVHVIVVDEAVEPTCTKAGLTEGKHCSLCGEVFERQETVKALGHNKVIDSAVEPTCSKTGLTEGAHCSECGYVLVEQVEISALNHNYTSKVTPPTSTEDGLQEYLCILCGDFYSTTIKPSDFTITQSNRSKIGYTGLINESLVIPAIFKDNGKWYKVVEINARAFKDCTFLKSVTIPDSVKSIGNEAFDNCSRLTSVTIGNSVRSIDSYAFSRCTALTSVHITDLAAWCNISFGDAYSSNPLYNAHNLYLNGNLITELAIPDSVKRIDKYAFYNCSSLTSVIIGNNVKFISNDAFLGCDSITTVTMPTIAISAIPKTNLTTVLLTSGTSIGYDAFRGCTSLTSVTIPDSVTSIGQSAFYNCTSLTSVHITDVAAWCNIKFGGNVSNPLYYAHDLYLNGNLITELVIPDSVSSIGDWAFYECTSLTSVTIGNSVTSIGYDAFRGCTSLTSVTIPDSVTSIDTAAFYNCTSLTSVHITDVAAWCNIKFCGDDSNPLYYAHDLYLNGNLITELVIPDSITSIGQRAFYGCTSLTSVTIPDSVTSIGDFVFAGCTSLTSVHITDLRAWCKICYGDGVYYPYPNKYNLYLNGNLVTELVIPDSVTWINDFAFSDCTSLTSITIPDRVTRIGMNAFSGCRKLVEVINKSSLNISAGSTNYGYVAYYAKEVHNGTTKIENQNDYLFYTCNGVNYLLGYVGTDTELILPDGYNGQSYEIYQFAFGGCASLVSVTIPDSVTSIGDYAFRGCTSLTSVTIGNGVTSIGVYAFYGCTSLTNITIGNGVTSIGYDAFRGCTSLTNITIGNGVTSIGSYAFAGCTSLTSVNFKGTVEQWNAIKKGSNWNKDILTTKVVCSDGVVTLS